jgi:hypothetical protein
VVDQSEDYTFEYSGQEVYGGGAEVHVEVHHLLAFGRSRCGADVYG